MQIDKEYTQRNDARYRNLRSEQKEPSPEISSDQIGENIFEREQSIVVSLSNECSNTATLRTIATLRKESQRHNVRQRTPRTDQNEPLRAILVDQMIENRNGRDRNIVDKCESEKERERERAWKRRSVDLPWRRRSPRVG